MLTVKRRENCGVLAPEERKKKNPDDKATERFGGEKEELVTDSVSRESIRQPLNNDFSTRKWGRGSAKAKQNSTRGSCSGYSRKGDAGKTQIDRNARKKEKPTRDVLPDPLLREGQRGIRRDVEFIPE